MIKKNQNTAPAENHDIKVTRATQFENGSVSFSMTINGIDIHNCSWVEGEKNGKPYAFASFPSRKGKDGKYYSYAYCKLSDADTKSIEEQLEKLL